MASRKGIDLSLELSREEQDERLAKGGDRLMQLRLALGGMLPFGDGRETLGPPLRLVFEGWDASARVVRSSASRERLRAARPAPGDGATRASPPGRAAAP